jgi:glycosyltransferase involved in cell wall biosynthesis
MGMGSIKKRRVLFVAGYLPGYEGVTSYLITLTTELIKMGWEVALVSDTATKKLNISNRDDFRTDWIESLGIQHYYISFPKFRRASILGVAQDASLAITALMKLKAVLADYKPNVIHAHALSVSPFLQALRPFNRIPIVTTCHQQPGTVPFRDSLGTFFNQISNSFLFGDRCIALSDELKEYFIDVMKVPPKKVTLIYSGVDNDYFRPPSEHERQQARANLQLSSNDRVVCLIGSLQSRKGHNILLQAMAKLKSEKIEINALFAGVGGEEENIRTKIIDLNISDNVQLLGFTDTRQVLWASDVIVLPSFQEAFPLVIIEAMLCGVIPIRTPASGAMEQIEHGVNGFIFPFGDYNMLSFQIKQIFSDKELSAKMANASLHSGKNKFSLARMINDFIALYGEVAEKN